MVSSLSPSALSRSLVPRKSYARMPHVLDVPNLIAIQTNSFKWLQEHGLKELFEEISPIRDLIGSRLELSFESYEFREPRHNEQECRERDLTYSAPLYVKTRLLVKATGEIKEESIFFGDMPMMTGKGTFITSGAERVVVSQLLRSPGVYFTADEDVGSGRKLCRAKLIPTRGAWLEFETSNRDIISVKINGKRKIPISTLMRAIGYETDADILKLFADVDVNPDHPYIQTTLDRDSGIANQNEALIDIYKKLRPGDPPSLDNARKLIDNLFFNASRYDLGRVGRHKLTNRLKNDVDMSVRALTNDDLVGIVRHILMVNNGEDTPDEIDHLGNRRVRTVGELVQNQMRIGLMRLERVVKERMSISATEGISPSTLVNIRPVVAAIREFFGGSQLSQFMDQTNPLAELTHKRRLSAMGPGGLSRERAGFDVRDVHFSHYGRICPIETPEGPNIGLIGSPATYSMVNDYGFIETPYRIVRKELDNTDPDLENRRAGDTLRDEAGEIIVKAGGVIRAKNLAQIAALPACRIPVAPFASDEVVYLTADKEDDSIVAQAKIELDARGQFTTDRVEARLADNYMFAQPTDIVYMDVSPKQIVSVATALIPFLEHDDANRALMGANMQRQAVPLIRPNAPIVATGMEIEAARHSGQLLFAESDGVVSFVGGERLDGEVNPNAEAATSVIRITRDDGETDNYKLMKFVRTNQGTCINQQPVVRQGDRVVAGQLLADTSATENGELALGQNVLVAFMSWEGYNYEDAIILSERIVAEDHFASIHVAKYEVEARDTKLGPEEITRDIPNVGEESLRELDEEGIIRIGAEVGPNDILVGKITPKGETELSAEEKLLRAIFGEKAREVKDTSLRVPHGEWGKVINVKEFSRDNNDELSAGVNRWVQVWVAQKRRVSVGDKLSGRHGNKGVISLISPKEDMPFLPDGTPVDIVLNPIGVPSRMNLGQVLETHLGWAADILGMRIMTPVFDGATDADIEDSLGRAWLVQRSNAIEMGPGDEPVDVKIQTAVDWVNGLGYPGDKAFSQNSPLGLAREVCLRIWLDEQGVPAAELSPENVESEVDRLIRDQNAAPPILGKIQLRDGRTGKPFDNPVTVGYIYMMKLTHLVEDKVHARSTGPYSLITQQPLGGKAQFGGQRFGEMEVWALEAYSSAHNLQEFLTIKSDDVTGRAKTYEAIVKGEEIMQPGIPESFKVLVKELQSLGLAVEVISDDDELGLIEDVEPDALLEDELGALPAAPVEYADDGTPIPVEMVSDAVGDSEDEDVSDSVETEELAGYHPSDSGETDLTGADNPTVEADAGEVPEDVAVEMTVDTVVEAEPEAVDEADAEMPEAVIEAEPEAVDEADAVAEPVTEADAETPETVIETEPEAADETVTAEPVDEIETPATADQADTQADTGEEKL